MQMQNTIPFQSLFLILHVLLPVCTLQIPLHDAYIAGS